MNMANRPNDSIEPSRPDSRSFRIKDDFLRDLEATRLRLGLSIAETRVMDWGCGEGFTVARLRELGYDAWGVDVNDISLERGTKMFASRPYFRQNTLAKLQADGKTDFPDARFHFVMSNQVLEHVSNLQTVAAEISRITAANGAGLHLFPAKWRLREVHVGMPLVHWLPKTTLRMWGVVLCLMMKIEPKTGWTSLHGKSVTERAKGYCAFLNYRTFYRSAMTIQRAFEGQGFNVRIVSDQHYRLRSILNRLRLQRSLNSRAISRPLNWLVSTFLSVEILTVKGDIR